MVNYLGPICAPDIFIYIYMYSNNNNAYVYIYIYMYPYVYLKLSIKNNMRHSIVIKDNYNYPYYNNNTICLILFWMLCSQILLCIPR